MLFRSEVEGRWIEHRQECLCHKSLILKDFSPKGLGVNKKDSPRISKEIHIDRKQPLGVSLKGSSLVSFGTEEAAQGFG